MENLTNAVQGTTINPNISGVAQPPNSSNQLVSLPPPPPPSGQHQVVQQQVLPSDLDALGTMVVDGVKLEMTKMSDEFTNHITYGDQTENIYDRILGSTEPREKTGLRLSP